MHIVMQQRSNVLHCRVQFGRPDFDADNLTDEQLVNIDRMEVAVPCNLARNKTDSRLRAARAKRKKDARAAQTTADSGRRQTGPVGAKARELEDLDARPEHMAPADDAIGEGHADTHGRLGEPQLPVLSWGAKTGQRSERRKKRTALERSPAKIMAPIPCTKSRVWNSSSSADETAIAGSSGGNGQN